MSTTVPIYGFGGGTSNPALRVIGGTTRPQKPTPNMIWVNTDEEITNCVLAGKNHYILDSDNLYVAGTTVGYLDVNGAIGSSSAWKITPYIALPDSTISVTITTSGIASASAYQVFYDANKNLISTVARGTYTNVYSVPSNAKYIRISERDSEPITLVATYERAAENGEVWIQLADSASTKIAAPVGDDWLTVYPLNAKQYVSGAWVDVDAMSYQDGKWVEWFPSNVLYRDGTINKSLGGGLEIYDVAEGNSVTFGEKTIEINNTWGNACVGTKEKVDLSKYTKMVIVIDSASTSNGFVLSVVSQKTSVSHYDMVTSAYAHVIISAAGTYELNVANCGNAYVLFGAVESADQKMVVSKWYFE